MHGAFSANLDAVCESIISSFLHKHYRPLSPNMKQLHIKNFQVSITSAYSTACASYISLRSPLAGGQRALSATAEPAPGDLDDDLQPHLLVTFIKFDPYGSYTVEPLLLRFHAQVGPQLPPWRRRVAAAAAPPPWPRYRLLRRRWRRACRRVAAAAVRTVLARSPRQEF